MQRCVNELHEREREMGSEGGSEREREELKLGVRIYFSVLRLASASTSALIMGTQFGLRAASPKN